MAEPKRQRVSVTPRLSVSGVVEPRQVADAARR